MRFFILCLCLIVGTISATEKKVYPEMATIYKQDANKLKQGMTYEQVVAILQCTGKEIILDPKKYDKAFRDSTKKYLWTTEEGKRLLELTFEKGKLITIVHGGALEFDPRR